MLTSAVIRISLLTIVLLSPNAFVFAQQTTGSLSGVVQDTTGAIIPGATITLNEDHGPKGAK